MARSARRHHLQSGMPPTKGERVRKIQPLAGLAAGVLLLAGCAPDFVDDPPPVRPLAQAGGLVVRDPGLPSPGTVIPTTPKPQDVVTPPPVPDPGARLQPDEHPPLPPAASRVPPPTAPVWPEPPPNYGRTREGAAPLNIPNRPPAVWR